MRRSPLLALFLVLGCGGGGNSDDDNPPDAYIPSCEPVQGQPQLGLVQVGSGFDMPVYVTSPVADPRLFVVEKTGSIRIIEDGTVLPDPFITVQSTPVGSLDDERGLLGLAFPPDYATSGKFYVFYTNANSDEEVTQYEVSADNPNIADPNSAQQVFLLADFAGNHNGGTIHFGPDGYLYFGIGDGGGGGDPMDYGQNLDVHFGKIMRLDVSSLPATAPADNPFVGTAGDDLIYSYGWRNPYRWSFDRETGDIYVGDVGQDLWEEIDVEPASTPGRNYGWSEREATHCFNPGTGCLNTGVVDPILEWEHGGTDPFGGSCVVGGFVYRGCSMPGYHGTYFFADYSNGWVRSLEWDGANGYTNLQEWPSLEGEDIVAFGQDADGELYIVRQNTGQIMRIVPQ
jgi:glucose/arabinose dehydrogenase